MFDQRNRLTPSESQIARLYADGASYADIAKILGRSPHTVRTHIKNIFQKLEVSSKVGLLKALGMFGPIRHPLEGDLIEQICEDWCNLQKANTRVWTFDHLGQQRAIEDFEEIIKRRPNFSQAHAGLAVCGATLAFTERCSNEADALLAAAFCSAECALSHNVFDAHAHFAMGRCLIHEGHFNKAIRHFECALELDSGFIWAKYMHVFALTFAGRSAEAIEIGESMLARMGQSSIRGSLELTLAVAHVQESNFARASRLAFRAGGRRNSYGHMKHVAGLILSHTEDTTSLMKIANPNLVQAAKFTPYQERLHEQSGGIMSLFQKHNGRFRAICAEAT